MYMHESLYVVPSVSSIFPSIYYLIAIIFLCHLTVTIFYSQVRDCILSQVGVRDIAEHWKVIDSCVSVINSNILINHILEYFKWTG